MRAATVPGLFADSEGLLKHSEGLYEISGGSISNGPSLTLSDNLEAILGPSGKFSELLVKLTLLLPSHEALL